jgi:integrase
MLTELKLKAIPFADKIKLYPDRDGLYLRVSKTKKRWQLSFMKANKQRHFYADKDYPAMSLAEARKWAAQTRTTAVEAEVTLMSELSFKRFIDEYRAKQVKDKRSPATLKKFDILAGKYLTQFYAEDIRSITPHQCLKALRTIQDAGHIETSHRILNMLSNAFIIAKIEGIRPDNPCEGLNKALASVSETSRAAITNMYEFGELLQKIDSSKSCLQVKKALQLSPLLVTRPIELRDAKWSEFDFEESLWTIPSERMKEEEALIVPLSKQARKLLIDLKKQSVSDLVFATADKAETYSDATLRKELMRLGYFGAHQVDVPDDAKFHSPHGFRASFRTIADEVLEWRVDVLEQQLAHVVRDTNGIAYNRTKHLTKRVLMMQLWADFCDVLKTGNKKEIDKFIKANKGAI